MTKRFVYILFGLVIFVLAACGNETISIHHSGSLGDDETTIDEMRLGTIDFVIGGTQNAALFVPHVQIFELAYLFEDMDHFERAIDENRPLFEYFEQEFVDKI